MIRIDGFDHVNVFPVLSEIDRITVLCDCIVLFRSFSTSSLVYLWSLPEFDLSDRCPLGLIFPFKMVVFVFRISVFVFPLPLVHFAVSTDEMSLRGVGATLVALVSLDWLIEVRGSPRRS